MTGYEYLNELHRREAARAQAVADIVGFTIALIVAVFVKVCG